MEIESKNRRKLPQLTYSDAIGMYEQGALSVNLWYCRHTLLALCELATKSHSHAAPSRWRLKAFRATLDSMEGNDEVEVTGETLCEMVMHAMDASTPR